MMCQSRLKVARVSNVMKVMISAFYKVDIKHKFAPRLVVHVSYT